MSDLIPKDWLNIKLGESLVQLPKSKLPSGISEESGYYNLEIIDAHDCLFDTIFEVYQPDSLYVITSEFSTSCFGLSDGSINLAIFGGVEPYYINWLNNPSDSSYIENLFSGEYIYTVIDSNNCMY